MANASQAVAAAERDQPERVQRRDVRGCASTRTWKLCRHVGPSLPPRFRRPDERSGCGVTKAISPASAFSEASAEA
jgi:hypothetical protein